MNITQEQLERIVKVAKKVGDFEGLFFCEHGMVALEQGRTTRERQDSIGETLEELETELAKLLEAVK
jgi:hypothetical protein